MLPPERSEHLASLERLATDMALLSRNHPEFSAVLTLQIIQWVKEMHRIAKIVELMEGPT